MAVPPPPTRFAPANVQRSAQTSGETTVAPPPTRFGPSSGMHIQMAPSRAILPPATAFGGTGSQPSIQAKAQNLQSVAGQKGWASRPGAMRVAQPAALPAAPVVPYLATQEDWASGPHLEALRSFRFADAQEWLDENIRLLQESEGTSGNPEIFDAFIARNYAVVTLTAAAGGATYVGNGISAGSGPGIHGERAAFRHAVSQLPGAPYDWTQATAANLLAVKNVYVSEILSDRALCTDGAASCHAWANTICGGVGTTPVYYAVPYTIPAKKELMSAVRGEIVKYLKGDAQKFYAYVMSGDKRYSWMAQYT